MPREHGEPAFSRGPSSRLGKNDRRFEVGLPDAIYDKIAALALLRKTSPTEWARDLIIRTILGEWEATRVRAGMPDENPEQFR